MSILTNYIIRTVSLHTLMVLIALVLLQSLFAFQDELGNVGKGDYQMIDVGFFTLLQMPAQLYELFPVSALIGGLVSMGRMASQSELVVMRASGVSLVQIAIAVLKATVGLMLLVLVIGEWLAPASSQMARQIKTTAISGGSLIKSKQGIWLKDGANYIQVQIIMPDGRLEGLSIFKFEENKLIEVTLAASAEQVAEGRWQLNQVRKSIISDQQINHTTADIMSWQTSIASQTLEVVSMQPEDLNILGLANYANYLESNQLDATRYHLTFWQKLLQPLAVAVMMFLALSFISGPLRSVSMGARIMMGLLIGIGFSLTTRLFGPMALVYNLPAVLAAIIPIFLFAVFAILMLSRAR
jgi:lipopolysaccharide export system permease protein